MPEPGHPIFSPNQDKDSDTPKPVSFMVKETVCPRIMKQTPEQCDFKENGVRLEPRGKGCWQIPPKELNMRPVGNISSHWGETGSLQNKASSLTWSLPFAAGETVCGDSHPGPSQGLLRRQL